ncbi:hypothetical protein CS8_004670 [Cupriavidus sp. 8B]
MDRTESTCVASTWAAPERRIAHLQNRALHWNHAEWIRRAQKKRGRSLSIGFRLDASPPGWRMAPLGIGTRARCIARFTRDAAGTGGVAN